MKHVLGVSGQKTCHRINHHNPPCILLPLHKTPHRREPVFPRTRITLACGVQLVRSAMIMQVFTMHGVGDADQLVVAVGVSDAGLGSGDSKNN